MRLEISKLVYRQFANKKFVPENLLPNFDFDWIQKQSNLPWLKLDLELPYFDIIKEVAQVEHLMVPHREAYGESQGWKSFCLHGKSFDATQGDEYYNDDRPLDWTKEAIELMPFTVNYFKTVWPANTYQRLRLMLLEPGGYIALHKDTDANILNPINIALTNPDQCNFVFEKFGAVPFSVGSAFWLNVGNLHTVFNLSDQPRWHIIVHQNTQSDNFQKLVVNSYKMLYNKLNENG